MLTELVKKTPPSNGVDNGSAPVAIPGSGGSARPHMEVSSWRSNGDFRRGTPDRGTPPIDSFMKQKRPTPNSSSGMSKRDDRVEAQPGVVVHFTVPIRNPGTEQGVVGPILQALQEEKVRVLHHFYIPPHQPVQKELENDSFGLGSFNSHPVTIGTEDLRVTVVLHTKTWGDADSGRGALKTRAFNFAHTVHSLDAPKTTAHSTLVLKNLPFQLKHETLMDEMTRMACRPTYIRYYHDEKGMFKGIAFVKFPSRTEAEKGRYQLDQLVMHGRKVRVEFKHKQAKTDGPARGISLEAPPEGKSPPPQPTTYVPLPDEEPDMETEERVLDLQFRTFMSSENRELVLPKSVEGAQYIKKLCNRYHVRWDYQKEVTIVKKNASTPSYAPLKVPTPMNRPLRALATPPLSNLSFGKQPAKLALRGSELVQHCRGPLETEHSGFPAGRGRPLPSPSPSPSNNFVKSPGPSPIQVPSASPAAGTAKSPLGVSPQTNGPVST
eukprot:TRINITY_DN33756_c0_g1_i1.p1 TRINITY_DN33756_c0_g1~~TRINITY_DN33756_c0_g1_i1.p1  ORF type:complete len:521 (+),score=106.82 TRINITY_DN33756_c0_g1_i1:83-1564(+)